MKSSSSPIQEHYSRDRVFERIMAQLREQGINTDQLTRKVLAGVDEFHVRGAEVSLELAEQIALDNKTKVLDVGCGIGGPARMLADDFGCGVTGIDITEEYIRTAKLLSESVGLYELTEFFQGDATKLPFEDNTFDVVWTQHVQMNIEDKSQMYSEIYRVLKPNGAFIYYDIFSPDHDPILFPVPWAEDPSLSFLITPFELAEQLESLGLALSNIKDQTQTGIIFFANAFHRIEKESPPKIGPHFLMGASAGQKLKNVLMNLTEGKIMLQSGLYRKEEMG